VQARIQREKKNGSTQQTTFDGEINDNERGRANQTKKMLS